MAKTYEEIGAEIGRLVAEKRDSYGDSLSKVEAILKILYPKGIPENQQKWSLLLIRILDKLCRISAGHFKDSFADVAGYGICGEAIYRAGLWRCDDCGFAECPADDGWCRKCSPEKFGKIKTEYPEPKCATCNSVYPSSRAEWSRYCCGQCGLDPA